jgi:hypothetical protein
VSPVPLASFCATDCAITNTGGLPLLSPNYGVNGCCNLPNNYMLLNPTVHSGSMLTICSTVDY